MARVRIVTDSTSDLPTALAERYGITVVPLYVHFGEEVYRDGVELAGDEFFRRLVAEKQVVPRTSQPAPGDFADVYEAARQDGAAVVSIHISGQLSGTVQSAMLARDLVPEASVHVIDSGLVTACLGQLVLRCAEAAQDGASAGEITALANNLKDRINLFGAIDTLEYLQRGGRIGRAQALVGSLLQMKPIITLADGVVSPAARVRGRKRVITELINLFQAAVGDGRADVVMLHGAEPGGVEELRQALLATGRVQQLDVTQIGPVVGCHAGPAVLGFSYCKLS